MANKAKTRAEIVAKAIKEIRRFHRKGKAAPSRQPFKAAYGKRKIDRKATSMRMNEDTLRKARLFGEEYTPDELERLCDFIRQKQVAMEDGEPVFTKTHIIRLLTVRPKRERQALQRQAIAEAWTRSQLDVEIAKRYGPRRDAGRRPYVPADRDGVFARIESSCEGFRRWLAELARDAADEHVVLEDLPWRVRKRVEDAARALGQLQKLVTQELQKEWPAREFRRPQRDASVGTTASNRKGKH